MKDPWHSSARIISIITVMRRAGGELRSAHHDR